jgi:hypothetical protein
MADYIVSIDAGNGGTNGALAQKKGYKSVYFPSVRAAASGESLGLGAGFELDSQWVEWANNRYLYGDSVFISRKAIERHTGSNRYGNEFHLFLIAIALGQLIPEGGSVDLTLFAPPAMFVNAKATIQERLSRLDNTLAIKFKGDAKPRIYTIEKLTVLPEGVGALFCIALDEQGKPVGKDVLSGENVILDGGLFTLDALQISNGNVNPEKLSSATWEGQGIRAHILEPVLALAKKSGRDFELITIDDIDRTLRNGVNTGDYTLTSGGSKVDLKPAIDKYSERYSHWIANQVIDGVFDELRGIKSLIFVGGAAILCAHHMQSQYNGKVFSFAQAKQTAKVLPIDANCVGGLRYAIAGKG